MMQITILGQRTGGAATGVFLHLSATLVYGLQSTFPEWRETCQAQTRQCFAGFVTELVKQQW